MAVAVSGGYREHLQLLGPSRSLHPPLITNKLALFRATNTLPLKTMLRMLGNGGDEGVVSVESIILSFQIYFKQAWS